MRTIASKPLKWLAKALLLVFVMILLYQGWLLAWVIWYASHPPRTTAFMRQAIATLQDKKSPVALRYNWVAYPRISNHLKRAVIAAEDSRFASHDGVDWDAIEKAYEHNRRLEEQIKKSSEQKTSSNNVSSLTSNNKTPTKKPVKVRGGSTITQQLAKNLFLSNERSYIRKAQELVITYMIELVMDKERIFELYLNVAEWGEGIFGAEAAAKYYFGVSAQGLSSTQAARLAVMLPRPKFYQRNPNSAYLAKRTESIAARMNAVELP